MAIVNLIQRLSHGIHDLDFMVCGCEAPRNISQRNGWDGVQSDGVLGQQTGRANESYACHVLRIVTGMLSDCNTYLSCKLDRFVKKTFSVLYMKAISRIFKRNRVPCLTTRDLASPADRARSWHAISPIGKPARIQFAINSISISNCADR